MYACIHVKDFQPDTHSCLMRCANAFSPHAEPLPDAVLLDIRGSSRLFGGMKDIALAIARQAAELGLNASIGVAVNPAIAKAAARGCSGITVVHPGEEADVLGPLPLALLEPEEELGETLSSWGIRTFADLAALPDTGIAERLGPEGVRLQELARGIACRPLIPVEQAEIFEAAVELEHPLELLEPLSFLLSRLLHDICGRLRSRSLATNQLMLRLNIEDQKEFTRTVQTPFASCEAATFLKLLQYDLAAHPPPGPITGVWLHAVPVQARVVQGGLFVPLAPEPEKLELTLARVAAVVGVENAGTPELLDTHRPGAFRMIPFRTGRASPAHATPAEPRLVLRVLRPALPAIVMVAAGRPQHVQARGIKGRVTYYSGPWRTAGDWWRCDPWARDEWDVALDNGAVYRLYRQGSHEWFVEGNYD
jgi:protein ImuB